MIWPTINWEALGPWLRPAALFGASAAGGYWLGQSQAERGAWVPAAGALVLTAVVALVWQLRSRARAQWQAFLNAYADREIARSHRRTTMTTAP